MWASRVHVCLNGRQQRTQRTQRLSCYGRGVAWVSTCAPRAHVHLCVRVRLLLQLLLVLVAALAPPLYCHHRHTASCVVAGQ
jgi:hypothetical protein